MLQIQQASRACPAAVGYARFHPRISMRMKQHSSRLDPSVARETARRELAALISRFAPTDGAHQTAIPSLTFYRYSQPVDLGCGVTSSAFVFAAQGAKRVMVAGQAYVYDHLHCLVTSVDLPVMSQVTRASPDAPYLCVKFTLDPQRIVELATQLRLPEPDATSAGEGIARRFAVGTRFRRRTATRTIARYSG
jgi:hypothetical protein